MSIIKGIFRSVWDNGDTTIETSAELNTDTGEVTAESSNVDTIKLFCLDEEVFVDENGKEYDICPICHEYIMKTIVVETVGKQLIEQTFCSNDECENGEYGV